MPGFSGIELHFWPPRVTGQSRFDWARNREKGRAVPTCRAAPMRSSVGGSNCIDAVWTRTSIGRFKLEVRTRKQMSCLPHDPRRATATFHICYSLTRSYYQHQSLPIRARCRSGVESDQHGPESTARSGRASALPCPDSLDAVALLRRRDGPTDCWSVGEFYDLGRIRS